MNNLPYTPVNADVLASPISRLLGHFFGRLTSKIGAGGVTTIMSVLNILLFHAANSLDASVIPKNPNAPNPYDPAHVEPTP